MSEIPNVLVATPAAGSAVDIEYLHSITRLQKETGGAGQERMNFDISTVAISDLPVARNILAHRFLSDPDYSHILFVDADMGFWPSLVTGMLAFDKPFIGVAYPARAMDMASFRRAAAIEDDNAKAAALARDYVCAESIVPTQTSDAGIPNYVVQAGRFLPTKEVGTGILLLQRKVFSDIANFFPDIVLTDSMTYTRMGVTGAVGQYFSSFRDEDGELLGDDLSFCRRWTATGGEIWTCVSEQTLHVGRTVHAGTYLDRMRRGLLQTKEP